MRARRTKTRPEKTSTGSVVERTAAAVFRPARAWAPEDAQGRSRVERALQRVVVDVRMGRERARQRVTEANEEIDPRLLEQERVVSARIVKTSVAAQPASIDRENLM